MLKHLSIKNYLLIKDLELEFKNGFTVITGETGAGKTILIGALSLILGKRADTGALLEKKNKCVIEGTFSVSGYGLEGFFTQYDLDYDEHAVLRREINKHGKSRAFINDTPVNLPVLTSLGHRLVDIHSQHQTLMLNESGFQMAILDNFANNTTLLNAYAEAHQSYNALRADLDQLIAKEAEMRAEGDYLSFQYNEIETAALREDELKELEEELKVLSNAEEIKGNLYRASQQLGLTENNIIDSLQEVISQTGKIAGYHQDIAAINERLESLGIEMKDISSSLERLEESINYDPAHLEEISNRVDMITGLLQKHKALDVKSLLEIRDRIGEKLHGISTLDDDIGTLKKNTEKANADLKHIARELSKKRKTGIPVIEKEITATLKKLGMKDAELRIDLQEVDKFLPGGMNIVEFRFSANRGSSPAPVSKIASGGELSRLMLALKSMITKKSLLPTIILDEIDMGVSGDIAGKVGNLLKAMSGNMQLIAITHIPQIAGKAADHLRVYKKYADDRTVSGVERLSDSERIDEIALMLSNEKLSAAAKETAKELLN
ncbi:MAG: DNA repair protein RecN [Bacteroidetes bacterium]|nr:DNA repair protein RecN [Bacteroidota bacterium]